MDGTILIADDDRSIRTVLTQALTRAGCRVHATGALQQLSRWVEEGRGDLVITDVMMPDGNGIDMIPAIRQARPDLPVIVISAQNTIVTAIRATEAEAFEYLPKPFDLPELMTRARAALEHRPQRGETALPQDIALPDPAEAGENAALPLIGHAAPMQAMFRLVARLINAELPVAITGAAGTGKTMLAHALHDYSDRRDGPLVVVSAADAATKLSSDTLGQASGGTLVIENPAGMAAEDQSRLLALLDQGAAGGRGPRLVATLGPDPQADIAAGRLRPDLFYRLAGAVISVPPLTARLDDLPALCSDMLTRAADQGLPRRSLSEAGLAVLRGWDFPGNLRELSHLLQRLALTASGDEITADEVTQALSEQPRSDGALPLTAAPSDPAARLIPAAAPMTAQPMAAPRRPAPAGQALAADSQLSASVAAHLQRYFDMHGDALPPPGLYDRILREIETPLLEIALDATRGNQLRCAELLGINRNTLRKKLSDLNIEVTRRRKLM